MRRPHDHPHRAFRSILRAMREEHQGGVSPDLADSVMARLGYARATPKASRWATITRWGWRTATSLTVLAFVGMALWSVHQARSERSRPNSVEEVVRASLAQKSRWLGEVADGIQPIGRGFEQSLESARRAPRAPIAPKAELPVLVPHPASEGTAPAEAPLKKV